MRNGYTDEQLDAIEKLMDQLPHLPGMFQAGEDGWEDVISGVYDIIQAKRAAIQFRDSIVAHLKDSLGLVDATGDEEPSMIRASGIIHIPNRGIFLTNSGLPVQATHYGAHTTDHDHVSPDEPAQEAPYPSFLATVVKGLGFNVETTGDGPYTHAFRLPTEISGSLEMELQVSMDEFKEIFPDPVWPQVSYPEHEKPEGGNFVLIECPSRFEGKRWVPLGDLVFCGVDIAESGQDKSEEWLSPPPGFIFKRFYVDPAELMSENNLEPDPTWPPMRLIKDPTRYD